MSRNSKIIIGVLGLLAIVALSCFFLFCPKSQKEGFLPPTVETEGKHQLLMLRTHILVHQIETESFEGVDFSTLKGIEDGEFAVGVVSTGENDTEGHWMGNTTNPELIAKAKEVCPDCVITKDGFKAIAIAVKDGKYVARTITHDDGNVKDLDIK